MQWISQIWILFQTLAAQSGPKGIKATKPEGQNWKDLNQPDWNTFFNLWQPKPVQKESKSPNQKSRNTELKWLESARFDYFVSFWAPKPVQKEPKPPNQKVTIEMIPISQIWKLLPALAAETCPKWIKISKPEDQIWHGVNRFWSYGARNPSTATIQEGMKADTPAARFEYFFKLWRPNPDQKESKSPNQKVTIEMIWTSQNWILF